MTTTSMSSLFDQMTTGNARASDPVTSRIAAVTVTAAAGQAVALLNAYRQAGHDGLTDEEAASAAGLRLTGYWKRCSDLRRLGCIVPNGTTRKQTSGRLAIVCVMEKTPCAT